MDDPQTSPITPDALDEFIRQLFVCHWVLGQMIAGLLERAQSEPDDPDEEPGTHRAYSMIRTAIAEVIDRHGPEQLEASTRLIDEAMDAISDDSRIFPPEPAATNHLPHPGSRRRQEL